MGVVGRVSNKWKKLTGEGLMLRLDAEPDFSTPGPVRIRGWSVEKSHTIAIQVRIDGEVFLETLCNRPRLDVYKALPGWSTALVCGFEIEFPPELLDTVGPGHIELVAVSSSGRTKSWKWGGTGAPMYPREAQSLGELKTHFSNLQKSLDEMKATRELDSSNKPHRAHLILETNGQYSFLKDLLNQLSPVLRNRSLSSTLLQSITFLCDGNSNPDEVVRIVSGVEIGADIPTQIIPKTEFRGFAQMKTLGASESGSELVLYLHEGLDLQHMDLAAFINDFLELVPVPVLMPALYGTENGLRGPQGLGLADLRNHSRTNGADVPVLFPTKILQSAWLSTLEFLVELENVRFGDADERGDTPVVFSVPPCDQFTYFLDLRQPVVARDVRLSGQEHPQQHAIQLLIDNEMQFSQSWDSNAQTAFVVVPESFDSLNPEHGCGYQLLSFISELEADGLQVVLVENTAEHFSDYFSGRATISLEEGIEYAKLSSNGVLIATSWDSIQAANTLRAFCGFPVAYFVQRLDHLRFLHTRREQFELAKLSYRGQFVPITNSHSVRTMLADESDCLSEGIELSTEVNKALFSPLPLERIASSVVCVVSDDVSSCPTRLSEFVELVKDKLPELQITVATTSSSVCLDGLEISQYECSAADLARLYSTHEYVLSFSSEGATDFAPLEAICCGALPIVIDQAGLAKELIESKAAVIVEHSGAKEICSTIEGLISDDAKKTELQLCGQKLLALEHKRVENISSLIAKKHEALVARFSAEREPRCLLSIIIPVHNALDASVTCIRSVLSAAPVNSEIIVVDDASDGGTRSVLQRIERDNDNLKLVVLEKNLGFVGACHAGLEAASPQNDIVLLNSDVVVSHDTFSLVQHAAYARYNVGIASALSTNSPHLCVPLRSGDSYPEAARSIAQKHQPSYPTVVTPEGQLFYIRRWALNKFGFFDRIYEHGFCEESDLSMRMFLNGVDMVCADNALISHRRSESYGDDARTELIATNRPVFDQRWNRYYLPLFHDFIARDPLKKVREMYRAAAPRIERPVRGLMSEAVDEQFGYRTRAMTLDPSTSDLLKDVDVVFILPSIVVGGGTLSVLQHVDEMVLRGVRARVISVSTSDVAHRPYLAPAMQMSIDQLMSLNWGKQKVIATLWTTAYVLKALKLKHASIDPYYYIQDYEPWFYSRSEEFSYVAKAEATYGFGFQGVAKTTFLQNTVKEKTGIDIAKISPGLDTGVFYPGFQESLNGRPRIAALYRPHTARRGHKELIEALRIINARAPETQVNLFGGVIEDIPEDLQDFVNCTGRLRPVEVANLYRGTDVVIDLSYWHGFGRMGLEGMACGAVPVLSKSGGVEEYAVDGDNAFLVDIDAPAQAAERTIELLKNRELRLQMRERSLRTAAQYSEQRAVSDWLSVLELEDPEPRWSGTRLESAETRAAKVVNIHSGS